MRHDKRYIANVTASIRHVIERIRNVPLCNLNVLYVIGNCRHYIRIVLGDIRNAIASIRNVSGRNLNGFYVISDRRQYR